MGAATSSNAAQAITDITNQVSNSTSATNNQISNVSNNIQLNQCYIGGDFNATVQASVIAKSNQLVKALQQASVQNDITQQVLQTATSKVGSLGVGYASASNSASEMVNSSTTIINAMSVVSNQSANVNQKFSCYRSTIKGNLNLNYANSIDFLSKQVLDNKAVQGVVNTVSQSIKQKASATVEGLAGMLIALAIIIGAIGYTFSKPIASVTQSKSIMIPLVGLGIIVLGILLYVLKTPPFFNDPDDCNPNDTSTCSSGCVSTRQSTQTISNPPLRYLFPINSAPTKSQLPGLLQIIVARFSNKASGPNTKPGANGGYNGAIANYLTTQLSTYDPSEYKLKIPKLPDILVPYKKGNLYYTVPDSYNMSIYQSGGTCFDCSGDNCSACDSGTSKDSPDQDCVYKLNSDEWNTYLANKDQSLFARYVLCDLLDIPTNVYIDDNEVVTGDKTKSYKFIGFKESHDKGYSDGISGGGQLSGIFGDCNTNMYKVHKFFKTVGNYLVIGLVIITMIVLFFAKGKKIK